MVLEPVMTPYNLYSLVPAIPHTSPAIRALGLWFGLLVFFFSPEIVHAEFLDRLKLVSHLRQGHYQKLEQILTRQERLYQAKKIPEEHVEAAYYAFANSAADIEEKLNEWVARDKNNGTASLSRGFYYWNLGWKARGGRYSQDTPNQRFRGMRKYFSLAWQDLHRAAHEKPNSGIPHAFIISIAMSLGDKAGMNQYTQIGLSADPRSFVVRWKYLWSLTPWWSGLSTEESRNASEIFLSKQGISYLEHNPHLRPLLEFPNFISAEMYRRDNENEKAIPYYQATLLRGRYFYFSYSLGKALSALDRQEQALSEFTKALQARPQVADIHNDRAWTLAALDRPDEALKEQARAIALDELDPGNLRRYAWRLKRHHKLQEAETALTQALTYGSYDHRVVGNLGRLYLADLHSPKQALPYLKKAVQLKPEKPWYWMNYGWALNQLADCKAVEALRRYNRQCMITGNCDSDNIDWAKKTSQRMIWKQGCWREHPTLKILKRLITWLPSL